MRSCPLNGGNSSFWNRTLLSSWLAFLPVAKEPPGVIVEVLMH
jgi:hypothetical protein